MPCLERVMRASLSSVVFALVAACDDSTSTPGSVQVSLTPGGLSIVQGGTASASISISRGGGFTGPVTLTISGLPTGVAAVVTPAQLNGTTVTATVDVSVALFAAPGSSSATIVASATGIPEARANFQLTISPAPDFRVNIPSPVLNVNAGGSGVASVSIDRTNYTGAVELSVQNPPAGITGTFNPASPTTSSSTLTISVAPGVTPASYPLTVQGSASGIGARIATFTVTVQPQPGAFTVSLSPASFTVPRGNSATIDITLSRTDYSGPITLAFENPPPGFTGTITPANTTNNTATFDFTVGDNVAPAIYQLRVRGSAPGFIDRVAFAQVTVTAPVGGDVEYLYCDASTVPAFFGYQDGSGTWKKVTPTVTGAITRFAFTLAQGRGGVIAVYHVSSPRVATMLDRKRLNSVRGPTVRAARQSHARNASRLMRNLAVSAPLVDEYQTEVLYGTATELAQDGVDNCRLTQSTKTATATVNNVPAGAFGIVSLGEATGVFSGGVSNNPLTIEGVPQGTLDIIGSRLVAGNAPDRVFVLRGIEVPDGGAVPQPVDYIGAASSAPAVAQATINGGGSDLLEVFTDLVTSNSRGSLWFDLAPSQTAPRPWAGLSNGAMVQGDFHGLSVFATPITGAGDFRVVLQFVGAVADQTLSLGPTLATPTATQVAAGSYPRFRFQGSLQADYDKGVSIDILPESGTGNSFSIIASSAWLLGAGNPLAYNLTMPDVSALASFPVASRLVPGPNDALATGFGFTGQGTFDLRPAVGTGFKAAARGFAIGVP